MATRRPALTTRSSMPARLLVLALVTLLLLLAVQVQSAAGIG